MGWMPPIDSWRLRRVRVSALTRQLGAELAAGFLGANARRVFRLCGLLQLAADLTDAIVART